MRLATPALKIADGPRDVLDRWGRSRTAPAREVARAAADGEPNTMIGARVGVSPTTVSYGRQRFAEDGLNLIAAIETYLQATNADPTPFVWTATARQILEKVRRGHVALEPITN